MDRINAIAKVRFASVRPQRIQIHRSGAMRAELLCMEPGQELPGETGQWLFYVVKGTAQFKTDEGEVELSAGHVGAAAPGERHSLHNASDQRLICLAVGCPAAGGDP